MVNYEREFRSFFDAIASMCQNSKRNAIQAVQLAPKVTWDEYYDKNRKRKLDFQFERMQENEKQANKRMG